MTDMRHMEFLEIVAVEDCAALREKETTYKGSWKRRGGVGAFMMMARKMDRLEVMALRDNYDVFRMISDDPEGEDGTPLAEIRDLRRYLLLVEAEMISRGDVLLDLGARARVGEKLTTAATHVDLRKAGTPHVPLDGDAQIRASDHVDVRVGETGSATIPEKVLVMREIDPVFERVISGGMIHERGRPPRPAGGKGIDGVMISIGDMCTCALPNEGTYYVELIDVTPHDEKPVVSWENAPGGRRLESWTLLRRQPVEYSAQRVVVEPKRERAPILRDGILDRARMVMRTPEDGAQHASLAPHVVGPEYFARQNVAVTLRSAFWTQRAPEQHVLDAHVVSDDLPRVLHGYYDLLKRKDPTTEWLLHIERVPADARDMFPVLRREKNSVEFDGLPAWQRAMYEWRESESKHVLREQYTAWAGDAS